MTLRPTSRTRGRISTGVRTTAPFRTVAVTRPPSLRWAAPKVSWSRVTERLLPCLRIFITSMSPPRAGSGDDRIYDNYGPKAYHRARRRSMPFDAGRFVAYRRARGLDL